MRYLILLAALLFSQGVAAQAIKDSKMLTYGVTAPVRSSDQVSKFSTYTVSSSLTNSVSVSKANTYIVLQYAANVSKMNTYLVGTPSGCVSSFAMLGVGC